MSGIYKFDRETMLNGKDIHIRRDTASLGWHKHWHNYYEVIIYIDSNGKCNLNGNDYIIEDTCLFMLTPKDFHHITLDGAEKSSSIVVAFTENAVDPALLSGITKNALVMYDVPKSVIELAYMMLGTFESRNAYRKQQLEHLLNSFLIELLNRGTSVEEASIELNPIVRSVVSYVITNPSADLTLDNISKMFGLSPAYFSALFSSNAGITYKKYVTSIRMDHAKRLLEDGNLSVLDVGLECGYNTHSQFIRVFKDTVGVTPSEYKKKFGR